MTQIAEKQNIEGQPIERPIDRVLALLPEAKQHGEWFNTRCPAHNDSEASFGFKETETGGVTFHCFAGCTRENILAALNLTEDDVRGNGRAFHKKRAPAIELWDLARNKHIDPRFLSSYGLEDGYPYFGKKVVRIPYYLESGEEHTLGHLRLNLIAVEGTTSYGKGNLIPYGLDHLADARKAGYVVIVEGESDCWTLWQSRFPALGIPGASNYHVLHADMLKDIDRVYISQELFKKDGTVDKAGTAFPGNVAARLAETGYTSSCYAMPLYATHEVKDPNDLLQKLFREGRINDFKVEMQKAIDAAQIVNLASEEQEKEPVITLDMVQPEVLDAIEKLDTRALYDLAGKIAAIEDAKEQLHLTALIQSGMKRHESFSWAGFKQLLQEAKKKQEHAKRLKALFVSGKTQILLGRQQREEQDEAVGALYTHNLLASPTEKIYVRAGTLVRIRKDEQGRPGIETLTDMMLLERLGRIIDFVTYNEAKDTYSSAHPSIKLAQLITSLPSWQLPALEGITETPVLRPDGTILDTPGYDEATHLCYLPSATMQNCKIPLHPKSKDLEKAADLILSVIKDFPFEAQADRANMIALLLTPLIRPAITGDVQLALIDGNKPGTGKGHLTHLASVIATGKLSSPMNMPSYRGKVNDEEFEKRVGAKLLAGAQMLVFDNIASKIESSCLELLLASGGEHSMRPLGQSKMLPVSTRVTWIANGNNLEIGGDLARRCFRIRVVSPVSNPDERNDYTIKDFLTHIQDYRAELIAALLTMARAWYDAGKPQALTVPNLAGFTAWAKTVGGILEHAGITGFQQNRAELKAEVNQEESQWENFLTAWQEWQESYKTGWLSPSKLVKKIIADRDLTVVHQDITVVESRNTVDRFSTTVSNSLFEALPDTLKFLLIDKANTFALNLGRQLAKRVKTPYGQGNIHIECRKNSDTKNNEYCVVTVVTVVDGAIATHEEKDIFLPAEEVCKKNSFEYSAEGHIPPKPPETTVKQANDGITNNHETGSTGSSMPLSRFTVVEDAETEKKTTTVHTYEDRLADLAQKLQAQVQGRQAKELFWKEISGQPGDWKNGFIPIADWLTRLRQCLCSENVLLVNNAEDVLESKGV